MNLLILEKCFLQKDLGQTFDEQDVHVGKQGKEAEETVLKIQTDKVSFDQLLLSLGKGYSLSVQDQSQCRMHDSGVFPCPVGLAQKSI